VPVLMRSRIDQVMHKEFHTVQADAELGAVLGNLTPAHMGLLPVVEQDGSLVGVVEAEDLLRVPPPKHHFKMRELARQDYVLAYPGELIDRVTRDMLSKNVENIIVVEPTLTSKLVGVARANDILQLRRWLMDEESHELARTVDGKQQGSTT
jgi:CBS domain-containing protein